MDNIKKKKKNKKKKRIIIGIILILIVILLIINRTNKKDEGPTISTQVIERRDVAKSIGATGTITTDESKNVTSLLVNYKITDVKVKEGDHINVGDVICTFDTSSLRTTVANLNKSINVTNATTNIGINSAQRSLNDAIATKDDSKNGLLDTIHSLEAKIGELQRQQAALEEQIKNMQSNTSAVTSQFASIEKEYNDAVNKYNMIKQAIAQQELDKTSNKISTTTYTEADLTTAESEMKAAEEKYKNASTVYAPTQNNTSALQTQLETINQTINQLMEQRGALISQLNGIDSNRQTNSGIAALQDQVTTAQLQGSISTDSLKQQVAEYNKLLAETNLKSTVSGTITSLNVKKDDMYTGGVILTIDGEDQYIIETQIDEYDIPDVKVGMKVLIKTDATRDEELEGIVIYTAPSATNAAAAYGMAGATAAPTNSGNATYKVKIAVKTPNDRLRLGMSAKLSIIEDEKKNVLTVPYDALLQKEDGSYYIEVLQDGSETEKREIAVTKGIEGTYYVEVISDEVKEGMKVVLPEVDKLDSIESLIEAMGAAGGIE